MAKTKKLPVNESAIVSLPNLPIAKELTPVQAILKRIENARQLHEYINDNLNVALKNRMKELRDGETLSDRERQELEIDYGTIPGVSKPFLKQPGAEKILRWAYCRPVYETEVEKIGEHIEVVSRVRLLATADGTEVFSGPMCSCSSMESNFRFRWLTREPEPAKEEKDRLKKMGVGRSRQEWKFVNGRRVQEWVFQDRVENPNIWDERNNVRQRSEKRALVKAVRQFGALSEIFTTDPNDWDAEPDEDMQPVDEQPQGRVVREPIDVQPKPPVQAQTPASEAPKASIPPNAPPAAPVQEPEGNKAGIEVDWLERTNPRIIGDSTVLRTVTKGHMVWTWGRDEFWHVNPFDVETLRCACIEVGIPFKEITYDLPPPPEKRKRQQASAAQTSANTGPAPSARAGGDQKSTSAPKGDAAREPQPADSASTKGKGNAEKPAVEPQFFKGRVAAMKDKTSSGGRPFMSVLIIDGKKEVWFTSWSKTVNEILAQKKGKSGEFIVEHLNEQFPGLLGLKELDGVQYEDGKVPVIQRHEQQPSKTLF